FSRSRGALWEKGETSGNTLVVRAVYADCDADALLLMTDPQGPTCHTGTASCFFRSIDAGGALHQAADVTPALADLERAIQQRKTASADASYTRTLLDGGAEAIGGKLREEAGELAGAIATESAERVASEAADVFYHVLVALASRDVPLRVVLAELAR